MPDFRWFLEPPVPAEITWDEDGCHVDYTTEVEWWDEKMGRRVRIWGKDA